MPPTTGLDADGFDAGRLGTVLPVLGETQCGAGPHVPPGAPLQPGALVFYGHFGAVHHVGMYLGEGRMVNAPTFDRRVQTAYYRWRARDTRPGLGGGGASDGRPAGRERASGPAGWEQPRSGGPLSGDPPRPPVPMITGE